MYNIDPDLLIVLGCSGLTVGSIGLIFYFTRGNSATNLFTDDMQFKPKHKIRGRVVKVSDGDGVRFIPTLFVDIIKKIGCKGEYKTFLRAMSSTKKDIIKKCLEKLPKIRAKYYIVIISDDNNALKCRFYGIDAPELAKAGKKGQAFAVESKKELERLLTDNALTKKINLSKNCTCIKPCKKIPDIVVFKEMDFESLDRDQYGRNICKVKVLDKNKLIDISFHMVKHGFAEMYTGKGGQFDGNKDNFLKLEAEARKKRIGIWANAKYISPSLHKRWIKV